MGHGVEQICISFARKRASGELVTIERAVRENQIVAEKAGEINKHRRTRLNYFASQIVAVDNADAVRTEDIGDGAFARACLTGESGNIDAHSSITSKPAALSRRL